MTFYIDLSYAVLSLLIWFLSIIFIIDGWKLVVLRKRILVFTLRVNERIARLFYDKATIAKLKEWHLAGRRPLIYGWISLIGGLFWLMFGIYFFIEFLKVNSFY